MKGTTTTSTSRATAAPRWPYRECEGTAARSLQLVSTKPMPSGVILNHYNVVGHLKS